MSRFLAVLSTLLLVAGCSAAAPTVAPTAAPTPTPVPSAGHTISANLTVVLAPAATPVGVACPANAYGLTADSAVVVKDPAGVVIGTVPLGKGTTVAAPSRVTPNCVFAFAVPVADVAFYSIAIGSRAPLTYSNADLAAKAWHLDLTLGS